jgi:GMP synthase (glutamine-hydrolysing)
MWSYHVREIDSPIAVQHTRRMKLVVLRTGQPIDDVLKRLGHFEHWFARSLGWPVERFFGVDAVSMDTLPEPGVDGLIITGSTHSVHDREEWSERAGKWIKKVIEGGSPVLGVCYGHQLIADVYGGDVGLNPNGREMGVCMVEAIEDPIFDGLPSAFPVIQTHMDAVNRAPENAKVIAGNELTPVQAMAIDDHVRCVQWHPEFTHDVIASYIEARAHLVESEVGAQGLNTMRASVRPVDSGRIIMRNFADHFLKAL